MQSAAKSGFLSIVETLTLMVFPAFAQFVKSPCLAFALALGVGLASYMILWPASSLLWRASHTLLAMASASSSAASAPPYSMAFVTVPNQEVANKLAAGIGKKNLAH